MFGQNSIPTYVPQNGLVAWYPFNGNANDESGNGLNGQLFGPNFSNDRNDNINSSIEFDLINASFGQRNEEIFVPYNDKLASESFSVSIWLNPKSYAWNGNSEKQSVPIARYDNNYDVPTGQVWRIMYNNTNVQFRITAQGISTKEITAATTKPIKLNEWTYCTFVFDGITLKIFINSELSATQNIDQGFTYNKNGNSGISIGEQKAANGYWYHTDGKVDDVGIWNRALSDVEITALYEAQSQSRNLSSYSLNIDSVTILNSNQLETSLRIGTIIADDSVSSYEIDMVMPDGLSLNSIVTDGTLSNNGLVVTNLVEDTLKISYASENYLNGSLPLLKLNMTASSVGDYTVRPTRFLLNTTFISILKSGLLSFAPRLGDVDNNELIQAYDASLALQYSVGKDPISSIDSLPWDNWRIAAADVDKSGGIEAIDASKILQYNVGLINSFKRSFNPITKSAIEITFDDQSIKFKMNEEGLYGFNLSLPAIDGVSYGEPVFSLENGLTAVNNHEGVTIGIASAESILNEFVLIPVILSESVSVDIQYILNTETNSTILEMNPLFTSLDEHKNDLPTETSLLQNYPNPFNPSTQIRFSLAESSLTTLEVYSIDGTKVASLVNQVLTAGWHTATFNAANLPTGLYLYRLNTGKQQITKKMLLMK